MKKLLSLVMVLFVIVILNSNQVSAAKSSTYDYNNTWTFQYNTLTKKTAKTNTQYIYLSPSVYKHPEIRQYIYNAIARIEKVDNDGGKRAANFNVRFTKYPSVATVIINVNNSSVKTSGKSIVLGKAVPCAKKSNNKLRCDDDGSLGYLSTINTVDVYNVIIYKKSFDKVYRKKTHKMYYEYVILHELGHTFGMGHLYSPDKQRICAIDKDSYLSIMCYQNYTSVRNYTFTNADKSRLQNIFGK